MTVNSIQQNAKTTAIEVSAMPNGQKSIYSFNNLFHLLCTEKLPRCSCEDRRDITCVFPTCCCLFQIYNTALHQSTKVQIFSLPMPDELKGITICYSSLQPQMVFTVGHLLGSSKPICNDHHQEKKERSRRKIKIDRQTDRQPIIALNSNTFLPIACLTTQK